MVTLGLDDMSGIDRKRYDDAIALLNDVAQTGNSIEDLFSHYFFNLPGGNTTRIAIKHRAERWVIRMLRRHPKETEFALDTSTWWDRRERA